MVSEKNFKQFFVLVLGLYAVLFLYIVMHFSLFKFNIEFNFYFYLFIFIYLFSFFYCFRFFIFRLFFVCFVILLILFFVYLRCNPEIGTSVLGNFFVVERILSFEERSFYLDLFLNDDFVKETLSPAVDHYSILSEQIECVGGMSYSDYYNFLCEY